MKNWMNHSREEAREILITVFGRERYEEMVDEYRNLGLRRITARSWIHDLMLVALYNYRP